MAMRAIFTASKKRAVWSTHHIPRCRNWRARANVRNGRDKYRSALRFFEATVDVRPRSQEALQVSDTLDMAAEDDVVAGYPHGSHTCPSTTGRMERFRAHGREASRERHRVRLLASDEHKAAPILIQAPAARLVDKSTGRTYIPDVHLS